MLHFKRWVMVLVCLASSGVMAGENIAVIDVARAIFSTELSKVRQQEMKSAPGFVSLQTEYDNINADIKAVQKEVESKKLTLSQEQAAEYKKKMEYLGADMELVSRKLQTEIKSLQSKIMKELQPTALKSVNELVEENKITLLLQREAVIFATPEKDLTGKLVDRMNRNAK